MESSDRVAALSRVTDIRCQENDGALTLIGRAVALKRGMSSVVSAPETHPIETTIQLQDGYVIVYSKAPLPSELNNCVLRIQGKVVILYGPTKGSREGRTYEPLRVTSLAVERWGCI